MKKAILLFVILAIMIVFAIMFGMIRRNRAQDEPDHAMIRLEDDERVEEILQQMKDGTDLEGGIERLEEIIKEYKKTKQIRSYRIDKEHFVIYYRDDRNEESVIQYYHDAESF